MKQNRGTLLLEVLIASTILSIGILAALNIFSASIHASSRTFETFVAQSYMEQTLFNYFLDPTSVDLETGERMLPHDGKSTLRPRLKVESLNPPKEKSDEEKEKEKGKNPNSQSASAQAPRFVMMPATAAEFFKTDFIADRNQGKVKYEFNEILYRYGQKQKKKA